MDSESSFWDFWEIRIDRRIRNFPSPEYSIGEYVEYIHEPTNGTSVGLIIGMAYNHYSDKPEWCYEIANNPDNASETKFMRESEISCWYFREMIEEEKADLRNFFDEVEEKYKTWLLGKGEEKI